MDDQTAQVLLTGVSTVTTATLLGLGSVGIALMRKKLGLQQTQNDLLAEKNMRDKLQNTLVTAVGKYVQGDKAGAVAYVTTEAADALVAMNVHPTEVSDLIVNKAAAWAGVPSPNA